MSKVNVKRGLRVPRGVCAWRVDMPEADVKGEPESFLVVRRVGRSLSLNVYDLRAFHSHFHYSWRPQSLPLRV